MSLVDRDIEIERRIEKVQCEHRVPSKKTVDGDVCPLCGELLKPVQK